MTWSIEDADLSLIEAKEAQRRGALANPPKCKQHPVRMVFGCDECRGLLGQWLCGCNDWRTGERAYCPSCRRTKPVAARRVGA